jgi:hypothetical protein
MNLKKREKNRKKKSWRGSWYRPDPDSQYQCLKIQQSEENRRWSNLIFCIDFSMNNADFLEIGCG